MGCTKRGGGAQGEGAAAPLVRVASDEVCSGGCGEKAWQLQGQPPPERAQSVLGDTVCTAGGPRTKEDASCPWLSLL